MYNVFDNVRNLSLFLLFYAAYYWDIVNTIADDFQFNYIDCTM